MEEDSLARRGHLEHAGLPAGTEEWGLSGARERPLYVGVGGVLVSPLSRHQHPLKELSPTPAVRGRQYTGSAARTAGVTSGLSHALASRVGTTPQLSCAPLTDCTPREGCAEWVCSQEEFTEGPEPGRAGGTEGAVPEPTPPRRD